ncbi:histidine kinase [Olleya sp. YSTF-M6]|uniref:Histidine kinase n=1 Tax=Olleya sediminilitoris TaxID=2795739 RepID=A0ABS1WHV7_9FLAO|nr:histidine kinase [Olleya sediminilitoris]
MSRFIFYILFLVNICFLQAQNPVFVPMSNVSKLPDVEFYDVIEDKQHYIWLAADKGLYRYNGKNYKHFSHPKQKANSLFQLKLDSNGTLWCNNIYGQIFYVEDNSLKLFHDASKLVIGQLAPFTIHEDYIRLFTVTGIYDIDIITKKTTKFFGAMCISNSNSNTTNYTFAINSEGDTKGQSIYKFNKKEKSKLFEITSVKNIQSPKLFAFNNVIFFTHKSESGNIIYSINKTNNSTKQLKTPSEIRNEIIYGLLKFNDAYWFLTSSGVFIYDFKKEAFIFREQLFNTESITDVEVDFNNNYWFTTLDNGVFVAPNLNVRRTNLEFVEAKITSSVALQNNKFVLGTNNGKLLFYKENKLYKTLQLPGKKIIGKLYFDEQKKQLIVSINASESFVVNLKTNKITDFNNRFSVAKTFSKINDSILFYGNYRQGIVYKNPFNKTEKIIIKDSRVKASTVIGKTLFVSYIDGFYKYNTASYSSEEIQYNFKSLLVNCITKSNDGIWLSTQHNGLLKFKNDSLTKFDHNLPNNFQINNIHYDDDVLWFSSDSGLFQYQLKNNALKLLSTQDGLDTAVNDFLVLKNQIIIIRPKAFYTLPKSQNLFKTFKTAKVRIETVSINDRDTLVKSNYKLPHNHNKIGLTFNSNGFQSNQHVNYQYRVREIDTSWQNIPLNTHYVNFNSLSSGTYKFELKAQNISAKQSVYAVPITFKIAKPFWQTYWFYCLVVLTVFGLIWLYFRWRMKQKERQRIAEIDKILIDKKITNLRLENLRSQMNPHFIFNALNSIQDYIVSNEKELASSYLVKFSRLIRMYLDYSQLNEITLEEEFNALKLYLELEKVRFEDELDYNITIDEQLNTKQIKVPSLFIQPYIENALKHGLLHKLTNRELKVEANLIEQHKLQITVEDNGIGRQKSEKLKRPNPQHKPFATKANEERVHLYKNKLKRDITIEIEDLYNENQKASGTRVIITMPI